MVLILMLSIFDNHDYDDDTDADTDNDTGDDTDDDINTHILVWSVRAPHSIRLMGLCIGFW